MGKEIMASTPGLTYRLLTDEDRDIVITFIQQHFIPNEPMNIAAGLKAEEEKVFPHTLVKNCLWQGASIGTFDDADGKLCAVRINTLGKNNHRIVPENENLCSEKLSIVRRILKAIEGGHLSDTVGTEQYMEHIFVAVDHAYARRGIASKLYGLSMELAAKHGCKKLVAICSSYYTRRSTEKCGYNLINEIKFADYVDEATGKKPFACINPPHTSVSLMVKILE